MAPQRNNDRHSGHTGTIPKSKVRNNCNVPQEAVTPTRRDMSSNLVSTSLDWVPVSEYNSRSNYNQSRKPANNSSDHELTDLDNTVTFESSYGRFVPVRPQPRVLPLNVQNRDNLSSDHHDDVSMASGYSLQPYAQHPMPNGLNPHSNHAAAAVMIVNPTTPNAVAGNMSQPFNAQGNQQSSSRNNLTRNLNPSRNNNLDGNSNPSNPPAPGARSQTKTVNLMNNMYEGQGSSNNLNEHSHQARGESARALGEAMVAACPDAAAVERRLGQIREYIRVTSSLVDTMRNSEDEAFIEHTKEEYDELVEMVMKLKESESKLEHILVVKEPDNIEVPAEETEVEPTPVALESPPFTVDSAPKPPNNDASSPLKKVTNEENEQLNKTLNPDSEVLLQTELGNDQKQTDHLEKIEEKIEDSGSARVEIEEIETEPLPETGGGKDTMNDVLRQNIMSCVEKVALIEEIKSKSCLSDEENQDVVVRPMSVQSNGSAFSENELWSNEIKNKMELSQNRLAALKQQQRRLMKYQAETKQQLEEMNRAQSQEILPSTSHDNLSAFQRMPAANQAIGVATTLPQTAESPQPRRGTRLPAHHDPRYDHVASSEEAAGGRDSDAEDEGALGERRRQLAGKLRELQLKKQHMENMVSEFQKLQLATQLGSAHNTYFSSGEDSADDEPAHKCSNAGGNMKNEDPFKLMEIKAIKTALQKTKDLMRSVEHYEAEHLGGHDDPFQNHANIHDNKSEGGASTGGWSADGSVCRVRNDLPPRTKFTNERQQRHQLQSHEQNIASLQELAQELRMETEKVMGERARLKDMVSNKEFTRKQKKVNEEVASSSGTSVGAGPGAGRGAGAAGPAELRQRELRNLLAQKQKELEALLNKEKVLSVGDECSNQGQIKPDSRAASIVNQSYNSEQEEPDSRSEQMHIESQNSREIRNFRGGDSALGGRSLNTLPSRGSLAERPASAYASDSDSASRTKFNQRNRGRRRQTQERLIEESNMQQSNMNQMRLEPRMDAPNVNTVPPIPHPGENQNNMPYQHMPHSNWERNKSNQINDMRANQFTQNSHSQTMDRLMSTPHMYPSPPSVPFNMMMPFGVGVGVGGCACGCAAWGAWCWQQLLMQQRDLQQLRDHLAHLEERWRAETASHTLNNQVPPGNRANNYWDNFRSYSRQNLLSASSKTNLDGAVYGGGGPAGGAGAGPQPLVERSHNALRPPASATPPCNTPKRNVNATTSQTLNDDPTRRRNVAYERSLSFSSAPDVLNVNQSNEDNNPQTASNRHIEEITVPNNVNINRQEVSNSYRNVNISNPIPEIIQSHANNINTSTNTLSKKKSCSKLPAKNSGNRRNNALDYCQANNINIASTSEVVNPNLASTSYETHDKATSKFFDLLRENVYSEVTALIGVNESHPDFLIQLFRDLQLICSDSLRQKVLQSIRGVLSQYPSIVESQASDHSPPEETTSEAVSSTNEASNYHENNVAQAPVTENTSSVAVRQMDHATIRPMDNGIVRFLLEKSEEVFSQDLMEMLATLIINNCDSRQQHLTKKRLTDMLSKYEGSRVSDVSGDVLESLSHVISGSEGDEYPGELALSESSMLQDVAGSLNLFSASDSQLHQMNCPYEVWGGHVHLEGGMGDSARAADGKVDLINCSEMLNGDLAEADQTCPEEAAHAAHGGHVSHDPSEALPDVVDTEETTPTEAEAEWLGLDRVPTRLHMEEASEKQKD